MGWPGDRWYHRIPFIGITLIRRRTRAAINRALADPYNPNPFGIIDHTKEYIEMLERRIALRRRGEP